MRGIVIEPIYHGWGVRYDIPGWDALKDGYLHICDDLHSGCDWIKYNLPSGYDGLGEPEAA